jgi:hypothetical protein
MQRDRCRNACRAQPLKPGPPRRTFQDEETSEVAVHPEVVKVAPEASQERGVLLFDRLVPLALTEVVDRLLRPS